MNTLLKMLVAVMLIPIAVIIAIFCYGFAKQKLGSETGQNPGSEAWYSDSAYQRRVEDPVRAGANIPAPTTNIINLPSPVRLPDGLVLSGYTELDRQMKRDDAMAALFAINHINWVVAKIQTYNDPAVLEEEYKGLTADALNLRVIKDPEIIDIICRILDVIVEMRIEEKERMFLKDELDQGSSDAMADAVSGVRISGLNPISIVANAITSVASATLNYRKAKRALQKKFERQNWALDKNRMYYLNDLNKELIRNFWSIVQKYPDLPDEYRVSERNINLLVDHLKDDDAFKRLEFLRAFEEQFKGFQPYWYHRAAAGYELSKMAKQPKSVRQDAREDALQSISKYMHIQIACGNILRRDDTAAKAALLQAAMMSEDGVKNDEAYRKAIETIRRNISLDDWQVACFCAMIAVRELNDIPLAEQILAPAISQLDWDRRRRLADWKEDLDTQFALNAKTEVSDLVPSGDALYECRTLIASLASLSPGQYQQKLATICNDQHASVREKVFCYGAMRYEDALKKLKPDLLRIHVKNVEKHLCVSVPFSWVIARGAAMNLVANGVEKQEVGKRTIEKRSDDKQYVLIDYGNVEMSTNVIFRSRFDHNERLDTGRPQKISYMLEIAFQRDGNELKPAFAKFGQWVPGKINTLSRWRQTKPVSVARPGTPQATPHDDFITIDLRSE